MKLSVVMQRLPGWYAAGKCVYLKSSPGRGKTTVLSEAPRIIGEKTGKNMGLVVINGPLLTPSDSIGYLVPKYTEAGAESIYTDPFWFRTREGKRLDEYDGGVILVDEADKMDTDVKKVIGEAALSGRLGPHMLPKGWLVWMAGNYAKDRSGSTKELDHLINRRIEIDVTDDIESWNDWALRHGVMPLTIAFANQNPHIVFSEKAPDKQEPWATPRSVVSADEYLRILRDQNGGELPDDPYTIEEVSGMIGAGASAQYFAFVKLEREMPKFETILRDPKAAKVPSKPDAQMLVCYNLAHRVSKDNADKVMEYIERMPKEFAVTFAKAACVREPGLLSTKSFNAWCMKNSSLMAQVVMTN